MADPGNPENARGQWATSAMGEGFFEAADPNDQDGVACVSRTNIASTPPRFTPSVSCGFSPGNRTAFLSGNRPRSNPNVYHEFCTFRHSHARSHPCVRNHPCMRSRPCSPSMHHNLVAGGGIVGDGIVHQLSASSADDKCAKCACQIRILVDRYQVCQLWSNMAGIGTEHFFATVPIEVTTLTCNAQ